jgi:drug/metabolite transporter (DMT)-like permease
LKEAVPSLRWAGIGLVILGVVLISYASPAEPTGGPGATGKEATHEHHP